MKTTNLMTARIMALTGLAMLGVVSAAQAGMPGMPILASIGLFGPKGYVASYEKQGDAIHIRICKKDTVKNEIESASGCELAPGTSEIVLSERDFRGLVQSGLAKIDKSVLSPQQKVLLERDLTDLPNLDDKRRQLVDLQKEQKRLAVAKAENPNDYSGPEEEKRVQDQINCIQDGLSCYGKIIDAKNQVDGVVDQLISDMNGKPMPKRGMLKHSEVGNGIAYNLLYAMASVDACDSNRLAQAPAGYMCRAGNVMWKVLSEPAIGKLVY